MAYQGRGGGSGNVLRPTQDEGYANIYRNYLSSQGEAMNLANLATEIANRNRMAQLQQEGQGISNDLRGAEVPYASESARLKNSLTEAQIAHQLRQAKYGHLTGPAAEAYSLEQLRENASPETVALAEQLMAMRQQNQESLIKSRNLLNDTSYKRASTMMGKTIQEIDEIENGFMPGSNYRVPIQDEQYQQQLLNQYKLKLSKETTDSTLRQKTLFANNIDKTLKLIDVDALTKYSGPQGKAKMIADQTKAITGKAPESYLKFQDAIVQAQTLAKQYRQTFGDSVSPRVLEAINDLTNPSSLTTSPEVAKSKFKALEKLLKAETKTFKGALNSTKEYEDEEISEEIKQYSGEQKFILDGQVYNIPSELIAEFLEANPGARKHG